MCISHDIIHHWRNDIKTMMINHYTSQAVVNRTDSLLSIRKGVEKSEPLQINGRNKTDNSETTWQFINSYLCRRKEIHPQSIPKMSQNIC